MAFPLTEIARETDAAKRCVLMMAGDRLGAGRQWSRHRAISGAAGAPEKKGLNRYGCVVAGGAHRGHRLLPSTSCRRPARPEREVPVAVSVSNCGVFNNVSGQAMSSATRASFVAPGVRRGGP